jgi:mannose-6-phosphate isomerase-like protein (cupin superfamily)
MHMANDETGAPTIIRADEGGSFDFGGLGVRWKIDGSEAGERFAVVHHPIAPRTLAAPLHYHHNEDEYSFVLEGTMGALLGDAVVEAGPGAWVFKPRAQWHTFWNAGDTPCLLIEVISPAGFEHYFREIAEAWDPDVERFDDLDAKYALDVDYESVPGLCERFGLTFP